MKRLKLTYFMLLFVLFHLSGQNRNNRRSYRPYSNWNEARMAISSSANKGHFSGVIHVSNLQDNNPYIEESFGFADKELKVENRIDTKFNVGSINKIFTAIGILQLIQSGELTLSDNLTTYVPELTRSGVNEITIKQLLQMRSGYGSYFSSDKYSNNLNNLRDMEHYLPIIKDFDLDFEPGTSRAYSNIGYELLGIIIQRITKTNYYDFIQNNIYNKAGMYNSGSFERDKNTKNLAKGYTQYNLGQSLGTDLDLEQKKNYSFDNNNRHAVKGTAAGGGYSTVEDIKKLILALKTHNLIDEQHTKLLINRYEDTDKDRTAFGFAGGGIGINSHFWWNIKTDDIIVVMSNYDPPSASEVFGRLRKTLEKL
ncbi:serine hydrolase domain-containing protein [uncultured Croceitalea sp.]|uniref:serine hydrolase domain-containing protein n=1 Tax=uncultured Croceitalea sp. TaxID=1798908 RepID=UPI003306429C